MAVCVQADTVAYTWPVYLPTFLIWQAIYDADPRITRSLVLILGLAGEQISLRRQDLPTHL